MTTTREYAEFLATSSRWERYRLARKTFRYKVYRFMEAYVVLSFLSSLLLPWLNAGVVNAVILGNTFVVIVIALAHYGHVAGEKPWLPTAAAFEAFVLWAIYTWGLSDYFSLPYFWVFCVFVFIFRFWQRGEREVSVRAFLSLKESSTSSPQ